MRNIKSILILCLLLIITFPIAAYAANKVPNIDIQAVINQDGSIYINQIWEGNFDEGTEVYIPMNAPDYLTISELVVSDQDGIYETVNDWNIDWSFEEKAKKCGINYTDEGYEICFGISQYGQNIYTISYKLDRVVGGYSESDGVNFRFVNRGMNTTPTNVTVQISLADGTPISDDIANIWGFGFEGEVVFEDGSIIAQTNNPLLAENHVTIMLEMEKGILSPIRQESGSFEEVKEKAFDGSDYDSTDSNDEEGSAIAAIITSIISIVLPIGMVIWINKLKKKRAEKKLQEFSHQFGYFREIPNEGQLSVTYTLGKMFNICDEGSIIATGMLRLIQIGSLTPVENQKVGFMGSTKETIHLQLIGSNHDKMNEYDEYLYTILEGAAGSDGILQSKELECFANKNDKLLRTYIDKNVSAGKAYLNKKHCIKRWNNPARLTDITPAGEKELGEILGLKRYLTDFSLIAERGIKEIPIWRELLIYAMLFGIADQVAEQMKELYPSISSELDDYTQNIYAAYSYHYLLYNNMRIAEEQRLQEMRSDGSGGFASLGGGGGSIGGGSGGGTR
jgi:hypothetical protein